VKTEAEEVLGAFNVSRESAEKLHIYVDLLQDWQKRMNLVSSASLAHVWTRHVADSLQLLRFLPEPPLRIVDLGSGAGFPGLVLALARPYALHLYESIGKKALFLREVIRATGADAEVHQMRIEDAGKDPKRPKADYLTARAVAPLDRLLELASPWLSEGTTGLFMKGQDVDVELTRATKSWNITYAKHPSITDSRAVILRITEARRV
jgi:16S rRNA (guanine527-N7)-methyltransferase